MVQNRIGWLEISLQFNNTQILWLCYIIKIRPLLVFNGEIMEAIAEVS